MRALVVLALVGLSPLFGLSACGGGASIEDICQRSCECLGNCETQQAECEANGKAYEKLSDELGCRDAWDDYVSCLDENLTCTNGDVNQNVCDAELTTFETDCSTTAG